VRKQFSALSRQDPRPPLYGLVHYESCRILFQPLTAFVNQDIRYLAIAPESISRVELVKAISFA